VSEQERNQPDSEKDQYPPDVDFGRQAARDAERLEQLEEHGGVSTGAAMPGDPSEEHADLPRAGSKAEPVAEDGASAGGRSSGAPGGVDDASDDSFPASDPPSSTGGTAGG
jgi:hypothetical protein